MRKTCKECGEKFSTKRTDKIFCSSRCGKRHRQDISVVLEKDKWIFDNYKEPLKPIEEDGSKGFYGVVTRSQDGELVQSHVTGKFYKAIRDSHAKRYGFESLKEYKKHFGLSSTTALCGKSVVAHSRSVGMQYFKQNGGNFLKRIREKGLKTIRDERAKRKGEKISLEIRNKRGTCPDQLLDKIKQLQIELGRTPTVRDFKFKHEGKYMGILYYYFGSWVNAVKLAGFVPSSIAEPRTFTVEELLERLRIFYKENGYTPLSKDFGTGILPSHKVYYRRWKTLNAARLNAGIPLVMSLGGGQGMARNIEVESELPINII